MSHLPNKNEVWVRFRDNVEVRVMSKPIENYVIARVPSCIPFLMPLRYWLQEYYRKPNQ